MTAGWRHLPGFSQWRSWVLQLLPRTTPLDIQFTSTGQPPWHTKLGIYPKSSALAPWKISQTHFQTTLSSVSCKSIECYAERCFLQCLWIRLQPSAGEANVSINFQIKMTELQGTRKTQLSSFSSCRAIAWEREIFILRVISFLYSAPFWWCISHNRCLFLGQEHPFSTYIPKPAIGIAINENLTSVSLVSVSSQGRKWATGEGWEPLA